MKITRTKTFEDNIYYVEIKITDLTPQERDLLMIHGEPMVDLGGDFGTFTAPHYYRKLYEDAPYNYYNSDITKVDKWLDVVETRLFEAIDILKSLPGNWASTLVHPLWSGSNVRWKDHETKTIAQKFEDIETEIENVSIGVKEGESIQTAINNATAGDTIHVKAGTYNEYLTVKDGIHIHLEEGVTITNSSQSCISGNNLTNFKLSGKGRIIATGSSNNAIFLEGNYNSCPYCKKVLQLNNNLIGIRDSIYYLSSDGINWAITTLYNIPTNLEIIGKDGGNMVYGIVQGTGFYYSDDNGLTWTLNNDGILSPSNINSGIYNSNDSSVYIIVSNNVYRSIAGNNSFEIMNWNLSFTGNMSKLYKLGDYLYTFVDDGLYKGVIDIDNETITWSLIVSTSGKTIIYSDSNGTDTIYISTNTGHIYKCKVTTETAWTEIVFQVDLSNKIGALIYHENSLFIATFTYGIFKTSDFIHWMQVNEGVIGFNSGWCPGLEKTDNYLYNISREGGYTIRYLKGYQWIGVNFSNNIDLEFEYAESLGYTNVDIAWGHVIEVKYSNLKLRADRIFSKRNCGLVLWGLWGKLDAKVGSLETGLIDTLYGSTALLTCCDGYYEGNEIICNMTGHTISPRYGIMNFKVKKLTVICNHNVSRTYNISQATSQASSGTVSIIESDELLNKRGKYNNSGGTIWSSIGFMNIKCKTAINDGDFNIVSTSNLELQIDLVNNIEAWGTGLLGCNFPYTQLIKDTNFKSTYYQTIFLGNDTILGGNICRTVFSNCDFEADTTGVAGIMVCNIDINNRNLITPVASAVTLKGINTFNNSPNGLLTFNGTGKVVVNGLDITKYKSYSAFLSQTAASAPVATILENSVGSIVWARTSAGTYTATLTGAFTSKTAIPIELQNFVDSAGVVYRLVKTSANVLTLTTTDGGDLTDGKLNGFQITFKIYN